MLKMSDVAVEPDEGLGEFLWKVAKDHVFTEKSTDAVARWVAATAAGLIPFPIPFKERFIRRALDSRMPHLPLLATRELLQLVNLLPDDDRLHPIPGLEAFNPFEDPTATAPE